MNCDLCRKPLEAGRPKNARFHVGFCANKNATIRALEREEGRVALDTVARLARLNGLTARQRVRIERWA